MTPYNPAIHESAHAIVSRAVGFGVKGINLSEAVTTLEIPEGVYDAEELAWNKLCIALAGEVSEYLQAGLDPFDALDSRFSATDRKVISQAANVLGRKSRELAVGVLDVALSEHWGDVLELEDALSNPPKPPRVRTFYATAARAGAGDSSHALTSWPEFELPTRDRFAELLSEISFELPSWREVKPRKRLFASEDRPRIVRDEHGDIVEMEQSIGFERLTDTLRSLEQAVLDAVRPRRVRKTIKRDDFGDIQTIEEVELS